MGHTKGAEEKRTGENHQEDGDASPAHARGAESAKVRQSQRQRQRQRRRRRLQRSGRVLFRSRKEQRRRRHRPSPHSKQPTCSLKRASIAMMLRPSAAAAVAVAMRLESVDRHRGCVRLNAAGDKSSRERRRERENNRQLSSAVPHHALLLRACGGRPGGCGRRVHPGAAAPEVGCKERHGERQDRETKTVNGATSFLLLSSLFFVLRVSAARAMEHCRPTPYTHISCPAPVPAVSSNAPESACLFCLSFVSFSPAVSFSSPLRFPLCFASLKRQPLCALCQPARLVHCHRQHPRRWTAAPRHTRYTPSRPSAHCNAALC